MYLIPTTNGGRDEVVIRMFPVLEKLSINNCPLLKSTLNQFDIVRELCIIGVDSGMPLFNLYSNLTYFVELFVEHVKEVTCLPNEMLSNNFSLQYLMFIGCRDFHELPQSLYRLHSLKTLVIQDYTNFLSFPAPSGEKYLTFLQFIHLSSYDGLTSVPNGILEHCRSLESLKVFNYNNLVSFPLHMYKISPPSDLNILECPKLISVPIGSFTFSLGYRNCVWVLSQR